MDVFIVRAFGERKIPKKDKVTNEYREILINFDDIETKLISPALKQLNLDGGTTGKIIVSGDIKEDMFSLLLRCDMVIADVSIHNANVFYELGIRHALRDKKTVMIKCDGLDETPFDIHGYRYLKYSKDKPEESLQELVNVIRETMRDDRKDSPVFNILPKLESQDPERFLIVPLDFVDEVKTASGSSHIGKLCLLAFEAEDFFWRIPAFRLIGESLFKLKSFEAARMIWEKVKNANREDIQANEILATIYQKLAVTDKSEKDELLTKSDMSIDIFLKKSKEVNKHKLAEAYSLRARNAKTRWLDTWENDSSEERNSYALQSKYLMDSYSDYLKGYYHDLNHYYSGSNALAMLIILTALAESNPESWENLHVNEKKAKENLEDLIDEKVKLTAAMTVTIKADKENLETGKTDRWLEITEADMEFYTGLNPKKIAEKYKAIKKSLSGQETDSLVKQIKIFEKLSILPDNVKEALKVFNDTETEIRKHYLLFTGHMIDKADRKEPRFPAVKEKEIREKIKEEIQAEKVKTDSEFIGISGGACGGDILFHEVCKELGITTELYLALPREKFIVESVQFTGNEWEERFNKLYKDLKHYTLSEEKELPHWLRNKKNYSIWERNNLWELNAALVEGGINMTLIALWDGKSGDGPGGTQHMIDVAKGRGAKVVVIGMK